MRLWAAVPPWTPPAVLRRSGGEGGSLGHDHGGVGVWVKQFFVEWREENIDGFGVQLLEGLQLLGVKGAQGRQGWNPANQLPGIKGRLDWRNHHRQGCCCLCPGLRTKQSSSFFKTRDHSSGSVEGGAYLGQSVFVHVVLLHDVLQSKVDLLLELLNFAGLHQPGSIWSGDKRRACDVPDHMTGRQARASSCFHEH